jgi:hypothetical protein
VYHEHLAARFGSMRLSVLHFYIGHWVDPETEHRHRLSALLMTLSHSRHQFLYPVLWEGATSWLEAYVAAFTFFGGAPPPVGAG